MKTYTVSGRKFSLKDIREDHLLRMSRYGILRKTDVTQMTELQVAEMLDLHGMYGLSVIPRFCGIKTKNMSFPYLCWSGYGSLDKRLGRRPNKGHFLFPQL